MELGIQNKRVLITGASQGIGLAIARDLAEEGAKLTLVARREEILRRICDELGGKNKGHDHVAQDLMADDGIECVCSKIKERHHCPEIIIHNVGGTLNIKDPMAAVEDWMKVWMLNVGIAISINNVFVPLMQEVGWGRVVHISSISSISARGSSAYHSAKAALNAYVRGLGRAIASSGVVLSAVMPGALWSKGGHWDRVMINSPDIVDDFIRHHMAIGRLGTADEIAPLVLFLCSEHATFATASVMPLDGGTM